MLTLTEAEIVAHIKNGKLFEATLPDKSLTIKIDEYYPYVCTAIHNGHQLRASLVDVCELNERERLFEEDPYTGDLISSFPVTIVAHDSRYEYDLNRDPENCVYKEAWGKKVWKRALNKMELKQSRTKHGAYYRILQALLRRLNSQFEGCILYDIHSYNYHRLGEGTPTFNIGTAQIDMAYWPKTVARFVDLLGKVTLPNLTVEAVCDKVFEGRGYQATFVKKHFPQMLVLPTEIKKVFMDEENGTIYPLVYNELKRCLKIAVTRHAFQFTRHTNMQINKWGQLLSTKKDSHVAKVDAQLYKIAKGIETLVFINPMNLHQEKKTFFAKKFRYAPNFKYRPLNINPYEFREKLYRLPVDEIKDAGIQYLYRRTIDALATKIEMLATIGTEQFLYNSLRYYGEPSQTDIRNARFLVYAPKIPEKSNAAIVPAEKAMEVFTEAAERMGLHCKVEFSTRIIAGAMVNNTRKVLLINKESKFSEVELNALVHHELGVHMVTTFNADVQPLKVLKIGLPGNTYTQEGLAVLCEYLSGNLTLERLKTLALRVLAVDMLLKGYDFAWVFQVLVEEYGWNKDSAFKVVARVFRGGGFTKDYLYLKGLRDAYHAYKSSNIDGLFVGKTGFEFLPIINEMISRGILQKPEYLPPAMKEPVSQGPIMDYLINSIR